MDFPKMMNGRPRIAVVDPNTLAVLGLKNILQNIMPIIDVDTFQLSMSSLMPIQTRSFIILQRKPLF